MSVLRQDLFRLKEAPTPRDDSPHSSVSKRANGIWGHHLDRKGDRFHCLLIQSEPTRVQNKGAADLFSGMTIQPSRNVLVYPLSELLEWRMW